MLKDPIASQAVPMRCERCDTVWYSRMAEVIVRQPRLARCVRCEGPLLLLQDSGHPSARGARASARTGRC